MAELLYRQYEEGEPNPAAIMNHFTDEEEHREVAGLFHTRIRELSTAREQEKALRETVKRVKLHSLDKAMEQNITNREMFQKLMDERRRLQNPAELHISVN